MDDNETAAMSREYQFVAAMCRITDPGDRAALRKGLKLLPEQVPAATHRVVAGKLFTQHQGFERAAYAVAAMIAMTGRRIDADESANPRNLGTMMAEAVTQNMLRPSSADSRLSLLTRQDQYGLIRYLPAVVRQTATPWTQADFAMLLKQLAYWDSYYNKQQTGKRWLQSYYRARHRAAIADAQTTNTQE